jgi:hypothetical protein
LNLALRVRSTGEFACSTTALSTSDTRHSEADEAKEAGSRIWLSDVSLEPGTATPKKAND